MDPTSFPPTLAAARARIAAVEPARYARTRNALDGAVTRLSPYITHRFVGLPEVLAQVAARHPLDVGHKFVYELGWREYFHHVWAHRGEAIFESLHRGPLPDSAYARELPADVREARTGVPAIDTAVRALYASGYLHNHARMWLASYVVHIRRIHWRAGADWLYGHLLDGDLAANHLSWQWVAGTGSHKPYLFNAENVARHAPAAWHSPRTIIDTDYARLDALARAAVPPPHAPLAAGVAEPRCTDRPEAARPPAAADVAGRDVWLVHPWALGELPADLPPDVLPLAVTFADWHARWPWNARRWTFVTTRMRALAACHWHGDVASVAAGLRAARSVRTWADPHLNRELQAVVREPGALRCITSLFPATERVCGSFSQWWYRATRNARRLADLPGLAARPGATQTAQGTLFDAGV